MNKENKKFGDLTEEQQQKFAEQQEVIESSQIDANKMSDEEVKERIRKILEATEKTHKLLNAEEGEND